MSKRLPFRKLRYALAGLAVLGGVASLAVWQLSRLGERPRGLDAPAAAPAAPDAAAVARGAQLARAGHCAGCHTAPGGAAFAGGRRLNTDFGAVSAANLTPSAEHGLGRWQEADFWRALHHGRSADGRALLPVCPFPNFTHVRREDSRDLFAYLQSLPAVDTPTPPHDLRWPYGTPVAQAVWRALFFRPGGELPAAPTTLPPALQADWQRGAYLVAGLGHCSACHAERNGWGAVPGPLNGALNLGGGRVPGRGWLAPALDDPHAAGLQGWPLADAVALLEGGRSPQATVAGPMALVVAGSTQHLPAADLRALTTFLQHPPGAATTAQAPPPAAEAAQPAVLALGAQVYDRHCVDCHGSQGQGVAGAGPALAGNRAVVLGTPDNVLRVVLGGGYGPATATVPRPWGMPPYATVLSDAEIAAVVSHVRQAWGHQASAVTPVQVNRARGL